ncbi:hypothetical protein FIBSPDRAFT_969141 [Athelia psychrophila]|uniref:Uncharacterized protein n=1 Tax=Athelia psychrophila TaxID=1759441 RepID=A0A167TUB2_9AGAM|nr:hypothetical protein FIBSPDRAFT_969141 [Fibularhizoctonia sp. CBS 109695]
MSAVSLLQRLAGFESLSHIPLTTFLTLIHRASALKRDISLPQTLGTSIDCALPVLPQSVALFLAESFWGVFKDQIWKNPTVDERECIESEALQLHGHKRGYTGSTIYPDNSFCTNTLCPRMSAQLPLKKVEQR